MSTIQATGFGQTLTRASLLPMFVFAAVAAYLLPSLLFTNNTPATHQQTSVVWKAAYSEKYPGCVSTVLWPAAEKPIAIVVLAADGTTARVTGAQARVMAANGGLARAIGACR
jgi:hypothetical protein